MTEVEKLRELYAPLLTGRKANHPIRDSGKRLVGFVLDEEVAGLSEGLFMLDALLEALRSQAATIERLERERDEARGALSAYRELREGDAWPLEVREALEALEDRYDIELVSIEHHARWVERTEAAESRALAAEALLVEARGALEERNRLKVALTHIAHTWLDGTGNQHVDPPYSDARATARAALSALPQQPSSSGEQG